MSRQRSPLTSCGWSVLVLLGLWTVPVLAQVDLTGMWRPMPRNEDGSGMDGDYAGLPLNASGRSLF